MVRNYGRNGNEIRLEGLVIGDEAPELVAAIEALERRNENAERNSGTGH